MRHVERNLVRAESIRVRKAERCPSSAAGAPPLGVEKPYLNARPMRRADDSLARVNGPTQKRR